ncbi:MAG: [protein-PII] uridylyltransferase [Acidimicrobiaceae bacterium]|nr:[protein-PII] uridylyltransferase [Acidimicrobiaceae bacterium]
MVHAPGSSLADDARTGADWCRAHAELVDGWLTQLFEEAAGRHPEGIALVAVGGYGRSELCPESDIDVMLLHHRRKDVRSVADRIWYPIWDTGMHLGHSVATVQEILRLASDDLDTATTILSARTVAGDPSLADELGALGLAQWQKRSKRWLAELAARVDSRQAAAGEVAFRLEPDLKEGRGGLRDVHALTWANAARPVLLPRDVSRLAEGYDILLGARVELQRSTGRASNQLVLQEQAGVARALGYPDADALMAGIAGAARAISWTSDDNWRRVQGILRGARRHGATHKVGPGVVMRDGEVAVEAGAAACDPTVALRAALAAASHDTYIERESLERLEAEAPPVPEPWPDDARQLLIQLLMAGASAIRTIEALDQHGIWVRLLPEWAGVRARPQHNAYHRFTVDRHLLETVANAARLAGAVGRPDLLVMGALLHDLGKGEPGDHTVTGVALAKKIGARLGFPPADVDTLVTMVDQHLLLPDAATRRDLDDPATINRVVAMAGSVEHLRLLAALTEADSLATGPSAWGPWKAQLVAQLVERAAASLEGGEIAVMGRGGFPTDEQKALLDGSGPHVEGSGDTLTVVFDDHPGVFSRLAGVLALHGLDVLAAQAHSTPSGRGLAQFTVNDPFRESTPWARVGADVERAMAGRIALHARISERARAYGQAGVRQRTMAGVTVTFDNEASGDATVIDVEAPDSIGVLYRITSALAEMDLDIRAARVQTLGAHVVDAFYVRDREGNKIDAALLGEVERAIIHGVGG